MRRLFFGIAKQLFGAIFSDFNIQYLLVKGLPFAGYHVEYLQDFINKTSNKNTYGKRTNIYTF